MLDEIDKISVGVQGDPAAALLEVLDPAQNHSFRDNYMEITLDLSRVLFIATANQLGTIHPALLDRMEIITLSGYTDEEKVHIARMYLVPRQLEEHGLTADQIEITDGALMRAIGGVHARSGRSQPGAPDRNHRTKGRGAGRDRFDSARAGGRDPTSSSTSGRRASVRRTNSARRGQESRPASRGRRPAATSSTSKPRCFRAAAGRSRSRVSSAR